MATQAPVSTNGTAPLQADLASFKRYLRAANRAPLTMTTYGKAVEALAVFLDAHGMPTEAASITREHVESYLVDLMDRGLKPATVAQRFRSLQQFFKWLHEEGEIKQSPMANMKAPLIPETPPPVLQEDEIRRLLKASEGTGLDERRDTAIIRLLLDTGMRRAEVAGLRVVDVDFDHDVALVMGKGRRPRSCPFGRRTAQALDRYLRVRGRHYASDSEWLWLGRKGRLGDTGIAQMLRRRAVEAGLDRRLYPHLFRHTFAHEMLSAGMQEGDLMHLAGWRSRQMLGRYGASAASERAREAYKTLSPGDRL